MKSDYLGFSLCICSFYPGVYNQEIKCNLKLMSIHVSMFAMYVQITAEPRRGCWVT